MQRKKMTKRIYIRVLMSNCESTTVADLNFLSSESITFQIYDIEKTYSLLKQNQVISDLYFERELSLSQRQPWNGMWKTRFRWPLLPQSRPLLLEVRSTDQQHQLDSEAYQKCRISGLIPNLLKAKKRMNQERF